MQGRSDLEPVGRRPAIRHALLLAAILAVLVVEPLLRGRFGERLIPIGFLLILLGTVLVAGRNKRLFRLAVVAVAIPIVTNVLRLFLGEDPWIGVANHLASGAFLAIAAAAILADVFRSGRVTLDKLLGAVNVYLLAGVIWALAFSLTAFLDPDAFRWSSTAPLADAPGAFAAHLYLSFVTLSTLGYGDLVPVSEMARRLALLEALFGQLYLAVLIGRLVGLHLVQGSGETSQSGPT